MATPSGVRLPLSVAQRKDLEHALSEVETKTIVQYDWKSEEGQLFIKELRKVQLSGVPLPWIAKELGVSVSSLNGAIGYWERNSATRGSVRRMRQARNLQRRRLAKETQALAEQAHP